MASFTGSSILDILTNQRVPATGSAPLDTTHTFTVNSVNIGQVEVLHFYGNQTVTSANVDSFFSDVTAIQDDIMCIRVFNGNLTINSGAVFRPPHRTKGMFLLVKGNLTNNGTISMAERGSNATAPTGAVTIWSGASIPATGATGGAARTISGTGNNAILGLNGSNATSRGTGGGGSGGAIDLGSATSTSGAGATGTTWSGGGGGGATLLWGRTSSASSAVRSSGSNALLDINATSGFISGTFYEVGGGAGNPNGLGSIVSGTGTSLIATGTLQASNHISSGSIGAGGLLMVAVVGKYIHNGTFSVAGSKGGRGDSNQSFFTSAGFPSGGGSGGGSFNLIANALRNSTDTADITTSTVTSSATITGGAGGDTAFNGTNVATPTCAGGAGGNGTATAETGTLVSSNRRHLLFKDNALWYYSLSTNTWAQATGTNEEPFTGFGMLDGELTSLTKNNFIDLYGINNNALANVTLRTFVPN